MDFLFIDFLLSSRIADYRVLILGWIAGVESVSTTKVEGINFVNYEAFILVFINFIKYEYLIVRIYIYTHIYVRN